jgi:hypothetical protein
LFASVLGQIKDARLHAAVSQLLLVWLVVLANAVCVVDGESRAQPCGPGWNPAWMSWCAYFDMPWTSTFS